MLRIFKTVLGVMLAAAAQQAGAFSLWGPAEAWQTTALGYGTGHGYWYGFTELGGTKNFGEGSRINVPVLTYAYDATFLSYFGQDGVKAVDAAIAVFNALPAASAASPNLTQFITQGNQQVNYTAQALGMYDIKSAVMGLLIEHLGLIGETHVFDLHERVQPPGAGACDYDYAVVLRNFDPITYDPTTYVNGQQYSYYIDDACPIGTQIGITIPLPADATTAPFNYTALATKESLAYGGFYLGLTRDDFGGLRYLYKKNNYTYETLDPEALGGAGEGGGGGGPFSPATGVLSTNGLVTNGITAGVFGGVEKVLFVKVAYDSDVGATFTPREYTYTVPYVTNSTLINLSVTRTITAPDILFTAADLLQSPPVIFADPLYARSGSFLANPEVSAGGGVEPSVISPTMVVTFNKVGNAYYDIDFPFIDLGSQIQLWIWGSFDGSTNAPVVYPTGSSLSLLEEQVLTGASSGSAGGLGAFNPIITATNGVTNVVIPLSY